MAAAQYQKGSLAALRAERANKKQQADNKNNILMSSNPPNINTTIDDNNNNNNNQNNNSTIPQSNPKHTTTNSYIDEYGFVVPEEQKKSKLAEIGTDAHRNNIRKQNERIYKWLHMLDNWETYNTTKKAKLKSRIRKGIPTPLRAKVWKKIMGTSELTKKQRAYYSKLRFETPTDKFKSAIDNDLDRTFPRHILFTKMDNPSGGRGKDSLKNVLYAYANHDIDVGYTQGMGFIAALFLMLMTEDDAFWCLCKLLDGNGDFAMRGLYLDGLPLLHMRYYQFNGLLKKFMPKLYDHIKSFDIVPALYASKWFITIFCYEFPFEFVYRIWDTYLHEGIKFVFRVSLALMKINESSILKIKEFEHMMKYLQSIHKHNEITINQLLNKAFDIPLKHEHLQTIEHEYNVKKLQADRGGGRGGRNGRRGRDVSELEQPSFIKKMSKENKNNNVIPPHTPSDVDNTHSDHNNISITPLPNDNDNHQYQIKVKNKKFSESSDEKKEEYNENDKYEGSHSDSSKVEESQSSVLPNGKEHVSDVIIPQNGHNNNNNNNND